MSAKLVCQQADRRHQHEYSEARDQGFYARCPSCHKPSNLPGLGTGTEGMLVAYSQGTQQNAERGGSAGRLAIGQF